MKYSCRRGAITKEHDTDIVATFNLCSPGSAGSQGQIAAHDASGAEHSVRNIDQVHGPAAAPAKAAVPAQDLGKGSFRVAALGKDMAMTAMAGEQRVVLPQMRAYADGDRFLSGGEMGETRNLTCGRQPLNLRFECADQPERTVHLLAFAGVRCGSHTRLEAPGACGRPRTGLN